MAMDTLTILIVFTLGAFTGTCVGLLIGYFAKKQQRDWESMSLNDKLTNIALVLVCSAICIAALAWYAFP
jgi:membrane protein YqaA with SNARE-associated domain